MSAITASYSTMQLPLVATLTLNCFAVGIAYCFEKAEEAKENQAPKVKAAKEMEIATKLGVAVDKIVSKSLFCFLFLVHLFSHVILCYCCLY